MSRESIFITKDEFASKAADVAAELEEKANAGPAGVLMAMLIASHLMSKLFDEEGEYNA